MPNRHCFLVLMRILNLVAKIGWVVNATFRAHDSRETTITHCVEAAWASGPLWIGKTTEIISNSEIMWEYKDYRQLFLHSYSTKQWPSGLNPMSAAAPLLWLLVRIPPGERISVCCECCVLSVRSLCFRLTTRPEESYPMWGVWVRSCSLDNEQTLTHKGQYQRKNTL